MVNCSIIIPVYFNEASLWPLFKRIHENVILINKEISFEVIFVDDGSKDNSLYKLIEIKKQYPDFVKIISFVRNFGQLAAMQAGYNIAKGDCLVNISADLQDPPELINDMIAYFYDKNSSYETIICTRVGRDESWYRRKTSAIFYKLIRSLSFKEMPIGGFDYVLISRNVLNAISENRETNPFWQGQILWAGFPIKFIEYLREKRQFGKSTWSFSKKIKYLIDGVLSYSYTPIRLMTLLGLVIALIGFVYALFIVAARIFGDVPFKGWAPLMIMTLLLSGIQMLMLGIIGEYLWRTLDQVRNRPKYIIKRIYE